MKELLKNHEEEEHVGIVLIVGENKLWVSKPEDATSMLISELLIVLFQSYKPLSAEGLWPNHEWIEVPKRVHILHVAPTSQLKVYNCLREDLLSATFWIENMSEE